MENNQNAPQNTPPPVDNKPIESPLAPNHYVMDTTSGNNEPQDLDFDFSQQDQNVVLEQFNPAEAQKIQQETQQEQQQQLGYGSIFQEYAEANNIPLNPDADFSQMTKDEFVQVMQSVSQQQNQLDPTIAQLNEYVQSGGNIMDYYKVMNQYNQLDNISPQDLYKTYELDPLVQAGHLNQETADRMLQNISDNELQLRAAKIKENLRSNQGNMLQHMTAQQRQQAEQQHQQFVPQLEQALNNIGSELDKMQDYDGIPLSEALRNDFKGHLKEMFVPKDPFTPTQFDQMVNALQSNDPHANQMKVDMLFAYRMLKSGELKRLLSDTKESVKNQIVDKLALNAQLPHTSGMPAQNNQQTQADIDAQFKNRYVG